MSGCRVFIGRLSYRARESDVERFFKGFGKIRDINLKNGYGFVEFDDPRDADDAVYELNNRDLCGERVTVELARYFLLTQCDFLFIKCFDILLHKIDVWLFTNRLSLHLKRN